jgi:hypothetical protein
MISPSLTSSKWCLFTLHVCCFGKKIDLLYQSGRIKLLQNCIHATPLLDYPFICMHDVRSSRAHRSGFGGGGGTTVCMPH